MFTIGLFALWMILNGRATLELVLIGAVLSVLLSAFAIRFCGWSLRYETLVLRLSGKLLAYFWLLFREIIKANLDVIRVILSPNLKELRPRLVFFDSGLKTEVCKTMLANSITITPGTITVGIYDSTLCVHALNENFAEGAKHGPFLPRLEKIEKELSK